MIYTSIPKLKALKSRSIGIAFALFTTSFYATVSMATVGNSSKYSNCRAFTDIKSSNAMSLLKDKKNEYIQGSNYILKKTAGDWSYESYRYLDIENAKKYLAVFDSQGRFQNPIDASENGSYGLFNFVLTDQRDLFIFRPGPGSMSLPPDSIRHTFPVRAEPVAAAGEMFFSISGTLVAVNPYTGHYEIDADLSHFQIISELLDRKVPLKGVLFYDWLFPAKIAFGQSPSK